MESYRSYYPCSNVNLITFGYSVDANYCFIVRNDAERKVMMPQQKRLQVTLLKKTKRWVMFNF